MPGGIALSASRFPFFFLSSLFPSYNNSLSLSLVKSAVDRIGTNRREARAAIFILVSWVSHRTTAKTVSARSNFGRGVVRAGNECTRAIY